MATAALSRFFQAGLMTRIRAGTNYMFHKHLLITNLGISISLSATGDFLQQHYGILTSTDRKYDQKRTFHMAVTGLSVGFICHHWYNWLDKFMPGKTIQIVLKKMVIDQLICSPATISTFFITLAIIERSSADEFMAELKSKSWRLYLAEWVIWPPAQIVNFYLLPTRYRVLYDNTVSLGYDVYTSYVRHDGPPKKHSSLLNDSTNSKSSHSALDKVNSEPSPLRKNTEFILSEQS